MGCHVTVYQDLQPTRSNLRGRGGIYSCRAVPTTMQVKITYKNLIFQACMIFWQVGIACFGRRVHVLLKCKSQMQEPISLTYDAQSGWGFFSLGQGGGCAQLDMMDLEEKKQKQKKLSGHVASSMAKAKSPKMTSCGPSNVEGDGLHLIVLKKTQFFGSSPFVIHITYYGKVANFLTFVASPK